MVSVIAYRSFIVKFGLSTPFRTLINLETESFSIHKKRSLAAMAEALARVQMPDCIADVKLIEADVGDSKRGFKSLNDDQVAWFSSPIITLRIDAQYMLDLISAEFDAKFQKVGLTRFGIGHVSVEFYDNTIAVLSVSGSTELEPVDHEVDPCDIELLFSEVGEFISNRINKLFVSDFLVALSDVEKKYKRVRLMRPPKRFEVFSDVNDHPFPNWDESVNACFWTHRVFSLQGIENEAYARKVLRCDEIFREGCHVGDGSVFHVGTSFIPHDHLIDEFLFSSSIAQYYFCLFDVLNSNQNHIFRQISLEEAKRALQRLIVRYSRMEDFVGYVENEFIDVDLSLQSTRKKYFVNMCKVFEVNKLIEIIKGRDLIVEARIKRRSYFVGRTDRRVVRFFLAFLASFQVLQLVVDLFAFTDSPRSNIVYGIHDLFSLFDFNLTTNILSVLLIGGAIYASYKGE